MKIISAPRQIGKTNFLLKLSDRTKDTIVCMSRQKKILIKKAKELGLKIPTPITHYEFINKNYDNKTKGFLLDDAEFILQSFSNNINIKVATFSNEDIMNEILEQF